MIKSTKIFDKDKTIEMWVCEDFLQKCPNPEKYSLYQLITKFEIPHYWHRIDGPSVINLTNAHEIHCPYFLWNENEKKSLPLLIKEDILKINDDGSALKWFEKRMENKDASTKF